MPHQLHALFNSCHGRPVVTQPGVIAGAHSESRSKFFNRVAGLMQNIGLNCNACVAQDAVDCPDRFMNEIARVHTSTSRSRVRNVHRWFLGPIASALARQSHVHI